MALARGHLGQSSPLGLGVPGKSSQRISDDNVEGGWEMEGINRGIAKGSGKSPCKGLSLWGKGPARG